MFGKRGIRMPNKNNVTPLRQIEDRPEGNRDEEILRLSRDLDWDGRSIAQALGISRAMVSKVLKNSSSTARLA